MLFSFPQIFFGVGFCWCGRLHLFVFFLVFQKNKVVHVRWLTKTMTKKVEGNTAKQPAFGAACRAFAAWVWEAFVVDDFIF
jgi:hypothetical protein